MEQGWPTVEEFVDTLGRAIDKESVQIKETSLDSDKKFERIRLLFDGGQGFTTLALIENADCVAVPATGKRNPRGITVGGTDREIWKVEERFQGDELTTLICHLKPVKEPVKEEA